MITPTLKCMLPNLARASCALLLISAGCAAPHAATGTRDDRVAPILKKMCDTLDAAPALRMRVSAVLDRPIESGGMAQFHRTSDITLARGRGLFVSTDSDDGQWSAWYRDKTLTILDRRTNHVATQAVPGTVDAMLDYMASEYDVVMPMADLLVGKTFDSLTANVVSNSYVGRAKVGGAECDHLLFEEEHIDWQIWIDAGSVAVPRKMVITYKDQPNQPQYVAVIDSCDIAPTIAPDAFAFTPPAGAITVSMDELTDRD